MDRERLLISLEACNAHLLRGVIAATAPPDEVEASAYLRSGMILEMFKCLAPNDALQATIACHCIMLRFVLMGAMRDAADAGLDPKMLARARSSAMTISRQWDVWSTKFDKMKARDAAAEAAERSGEAAPAPVTPRPAPPTTPDPPENPSRETGTERRQPAPVTIQRTAEHPVPPTAETRPPVERLKPLDAMVSGRHERPPATCREPHRHQFNAEPMDAITEP
jgi:hypothetical protein